MGRIRRYRTALSRHHRSAGYGIHSPYAFSFVLNVLRQRLPYYCYEELGALRNSVIRATRNNLRHPRIISSKNARLVFRITNHFNPKRILQIGTSYGVSCAAMMNVSTLSTLTLYEPHLNRYPVVKDVLRPYLERITIDSDLKHAIDTHFSCVKDNTAFILINDLPDDSDFNAIMSTLPQHLNTCGGVVIMRNISRNDRMKQLWLLSRDSMTFGQSFTNEKLAIIVANPKLQLEHFFLWF